MLASLVWCLLPPRVLFSVGQGAVVTQIGSKSSTLRGISTSMTFGRQERSILALSASVSAAQASFLASSRCRVSSSASSGVAGMGFTASARRHQNVVVQMQLRHHPGVN